MPDVQVELDLGVISVRGEASTEVPDLPKLRRFDHVDPEISAKLHYLEDRKVQLSARRGPWKDATPHGCS